MIRIKIYKNGYEIIGHADEHICQEVGFWHFAVSGMVIGLDKEAKDYSTYKDNPENINEGLSWVKYNPEINDLKWLVEDFVISAKQWAKRFWGNQVSIEHLDNVLISR